MPSLAYILGIGGPLVGWAVIGWLLVRASNRPRPSENPRAAEPRARAHP